MVKQIKGFVIVPPGENAWKLGYWTFAPTVGEAWYRKLGHEVIILFGDFTARIGDPTGEKSTRKQLSRRDVLNNVKKWKQLIKPLMDFNTSKKLPNFSAPILSYTI